MQAATGAHGSWALAPEVLWDGERQLESHAVVVSGDRIERVCPLRELPGHQPVTKAEGCTLLPGLIDCHVHLADWMLPGFLAAGVTTVRDTGNDLDWILERRRRTCEDTLAGPRILCCGPVLDGPKVNWPLIGRGHDDVGQIAASIDELAAAGVDAIKLYVNLSEEQVAEAVRGAARHGLHLLAHLGEIDSEAATALGVGEIEHLTGCVHHIDGWRAFEGGGTGLGDSCHRATVSSPQASVVQCPTLVVWDRLCRINDNVFFNDRRVGWVHPFVRSIWRRFPHRAGSVGERLERQASVVSMKQALGALGDAGCRVIAGSDTPFPGLVPGFALHDELSLMTDSGLSPSQALASATSVAADVLGVAELTGRIRPGLTADLLLVEGFPGDDISSLSEVRSVWRSGRSVDADALADRAADIFSREPDDPISRMLKDFAEG